MKKIRRLIRQPTGFTKKWALLMLSRIAPLHSLVGWISQATVYRKPKTLKDIYSPDFKERRIIIEKYDKEALLQARRRAGVDKIYQTYQRVSSLIFDQCTRFVDPLLVESPAQVYSASKIVHESPGQSYLLYSTSGRRNTHQLDKKVEKKESLSLHEEISFAIDKYELTSLQRKNLALKDHYLNIQETEGRSEMEKAHY